MQVLLHELFELAGAKYGLAFCKSIVEKNKMQWDSEGYVKYIMTHNEMDNAMWVIEACLAQILPQINKDMLQRWMDDGLEYVANLSKK